ncbi:DUF748 domain-containing protein [Rhodoflexus caldus]|uniref:DUF748 domain-containing protein n=1 Tax=Rhodoflexus caldus TaxID=2891236 RepID=UPI00202AA86F|nr:DUF748 domain-containing protein [Rhodoflexus caldus]
MIRHSGFMYLFRKRKRFRMIAGLVVFSLAFLVAKWVQSYTDRLLGQAIVALIAQETRGNYGVSYEDLQFEVLKNRLQLSGLAIFPHKQDTSTTANRYRLRVKSVSLETESLWQIYFTKELKIIGLTLIKPEIKVENFADREQKGFTFSRQTGNLYLLIRNYLDKFQIRHFALYQASLAFVHHGANRTSDYQLRHVNFVLQNLVIDSASAHNKKKIFYADGFDLSIDGQEIMLPDSLHAFTFDKLEISTQKAAITFRNFRLLPRNGLPDSENAYRMSVPELSFQGVDFAIAYNDNKLIIKNLNIQQPDIAIARAARKSKKPAGKSWQADRTFLKIMAAIFDSVAIEKFRLAKGAFVLNEGRQPKLLLPQVDFALDSFAFAVPDTSETAGFPALRNAELTLRNQRFFFGDSLYMVQMRYFKLTSHPAEVHASGIAFNEWHGGRFHKQFSTDSLAARLYRWEQFATGEVPDFQYVHLIRPAVRRQMTLAGRQEFKPRSNKLRKIKNILIDDFRITEGDVLLTGTGQSLHLKGCRLHMRRLSLSDNPSLWAEQLPQATTDLFVRETIWQNEHQNLQSADMHIRTHKGLLQADGKGVVIAPRTAEAAPIAGTIRQFLLKNLLMKDLMSKEPQPVFDTLRLTGADLQLLMGRGQSANQSLARNLRGTIVTEQSSLTVKGQAGDMAELWGMNGTLVFQPDSLPVIRQEAAALQGTWAGYRFAAHLPLIDTEDGSILLHRFTLNTTRSDSALVALQKLAIRGWDAATWNDKYLKINTLEVQQLNGYFIGRALQAGKSFFDSLRIDTLTVTSDSFGLDLPVNRLQVRQLYGQLAGLRMSPSAVAIHQINAFRAGLAALRLQPVELRFSEAHLADTAAQLLTFTDLQLIHKDFDGTFQQASLALPDKEWLPNSLPAIGNLVLADGAIRLHPDSVRQSLPPIAHPRIGSVDIQRTRLSGEQLSADIHLLRLEQPFTDNQQPFFRAHVGNLRWLLPNGRDMLQVGTLFYEPVTQQLQADSVSFRPAMPVKEFYRRYPFQRSYNIYQAHRAIVYAPQWQKLLAGEGFAATSAVLNGVNSHVFLDKNMQRLKEDRLFPLEKFKQMALPVRIDTVKLLNGNLYYQEKTRRHEIASFSLQNISGYLYGLNNRPAPTDSVYLRLNAAPEGRGEMDLDIYFAAGNDRGMHRIEATFDTIPLSVFNGMAEPLAGIRINRGQINNGSMMVTADRDQASGKMWLYYKNLKFRVLSRKTTGQDEIITKNSPLLTILANTLIRNKNRRIKLYKGKSGYIAQAREPEKSLFSYWGRIVVNGALSSIGISQRTQAKWRQQMRERAERQD